MNYASIRIEGAILSPDILDRLEDAQGQRPADFGLDGGVRVKDEIARAWADAQDYWRIFQRKLETLRPDSPATTETRNLWVVPLLGLLGYQLEFQARGTEINSKNYAISHRIANRAGTALHIVGYREAAGLDRKPEKAALRMSAHAMVQEYLNLSDELYGLVTNGRILRLLRDSSRLIKLTYLEFDLDRIFTDGLFADFAVLYRLLHVSRLPATRDSAAQSLIERYHQDSLDSGARIREGLSKAVEKAILDFANGFLAHPDNRSLGDAVLERKIDATAYYQHLLRLIYRLLFLMVIEERGLVFPADTPAWKRQIYDRYYSLQRLRRLSEKRHLADRRRHDLWLGLLATFRLFENRGPGDKLGLAPLAGDLFGPEAIGMLGQSSLGNDVLLGCLRALGLYENRETRQIVRVNYAALNVEEFGSVYEGLLEYKPVLQSIGDRTEFSFAQGDDRSRTGSHYTPDDLVQPLIKHSLDYLIAEKLKGPNPVQGLLALRVADISCGSGHILLAAARRIATELAIVRTGEEQPSPEAFRTAIRDVIRECIYGVDLNPLAVELCKVALWLEAHNPGEPLNFLDHHIKCGNAIVGFARREEVERGVPDEAFATLPGDDPEIAGILRKRNKEERKAHAAGQLPLAPALQKQLDDILGGWRDLSRMPEKTPNEIDAKRRKYLAFTQSVDSWVLGQIASIPIAQFYLSKASNSLQKFVTDASFRRYWKGEISPQGQATAEAWALGSRKQFFHWFLEFPEIIERGGFDCILGNPPYLGNRALSGTFGDAFLQWVKYEYAPAGSVDLVTYFVRRIFDLVRPGGLMALISTNTIAQGGAREGGLDLILHIQGTIVFAIRSKPWPGRAAVDVSLISICKGTWNGSRTLNGNSVTYISSYLDSEESQGSPVVLAANKDRSFIGSYVLGGGFILDNDQAKRLLDIRVENREVVFPYVTGDDLNSRPDQSASRWVINFFDWDEVRCSEEFPECFQILEARVKPERTRKDENGDFVLRKPLPQKWWIYADKRPKLYAKLRHIPRALVINRHSKFAAFSFQATDRVFSDATVVIASDSYAEFATLNSNIHEAWAWKHGSTMGSGTLRYTPSGVFEKFPFPTPEEPHMLGLFDVGERYCIARDELMRNRWLGITNIYNIFHDRNSIKVPVEDTNSGSASIVRSRFEDILQLRALQRELDTAVRDAYGWSDIDLNHDFYELETLPENDRIRYTIGPVARKEILRRLFDLNRERAEIEEKVGNMPVRKKRGRSASNSSNEDFFGL